jgi:hypothetical protein
MDRREFLAGVSSALVAASARAALSTQYPPPQPEPQPAQLPGKVCWLDVCAPLLVEDPALAMTTEILLTATCFPGVDGFRNPQCGTEYHVEVFDPRGKPAPLGSAGTVLIPAMRPKSLHIGDLIGARKFWGGARIRLAPSGRGQVSHAGDLFSAGFVRWSTPQNFDNVHAHPAAPAAMTGRFFYSMPFPSLEEYHCAFALFNPNDAESAGVIRLIEPLGKTVLERPYRLRPHHTQLYTLGDLKTAESPGEALAIAPAPASAIRKGGVVMVANDTEAVSYAYTLMKGRSGGSFSVEHPLHFADRPVSPGRKSPYSANKSFPAEAFLYTPLLFAGKRVAGLELESRLYLSASRWREELLWLMPFVTDGQGMIAWVSNRDESLAARVTPAEVVEQGLVRLGEFQSCRLESARLPLPTGFSGGFGVATLPPTSHSLMKVEVRAKNWSRVAFTHFRPGGHFHRKYRTAADRGGVATDYIVSGCQMRGTGTERQRETVLALMNIEFEEERTGSPRLQLFGGSGLLAEKALGEFPPLACRHLVLSELFPGVQTVPGETLTLRMLDDAAMMVVSALHVDYERRDLALEHGSDRHSTHADFKC